MKLLRAARKYVYVPARFYDRDRRELPATHLEVALVAPGAGVNAATQWTQVAIVNHRARIYLYGPDSGGPPDGVNAPVFAVPPGGLDLYVRPADAMESDPTYAERITLA
jgi:hypothetical protein